MFRSQVRKEEFFEKNSLYLLRFQPTNYGVTFSANVALILRKDLYNMEETRDNRKKKKAVETNRADNDKKRLEFSSLAVLKFYKRWLNSDEKPSS